jgi:hypothetical protein
MDGTAPSSIKSICETSSRSLLLEAGSPSMMTMAIKSSLFLISYRWLVALIAGASLNSLKVLTEESS